ncbi:MAG: hypothetical protein M1816_004486 [Peltula sp. TS41687]|nr:MAG: hypothetical protein M1816_004486 [Peltula sp. TS41687]
MRPTSSHRSSSELRPASVPLINLSRSPSPYSRKRPPSALPSEEEDNDEDDEDEDEDAFEHILAGRPLVGRDTYPAWLKWFHNGRLGNFLFGTSWGWQIYVVLLSLTVGGSCLGLVLLNRLILWTGVYKFPYPLTLTLLQLLINHLLLIVAASLTRLAARPLTALGLSCTIAPTRQSRSPHLGGFRASAADKHGSSWSQMLKRLGSGNAGIAGGGILEFNLKTALQVLPLAVVFFAKVLLSNLSFAYVQLPMYLLARIGIVPLSLLLTASLTRTSHSVATLSSTLTATLNLLIATSRSGVRVTWEGIVAGVFSSLFVALYPIFLLRTHRKLVSSLIPQGDLLTGFPPSPPLNPFSDQSSNNNHGNKEDTRATWQLMHYTSLLCISIILPIVFISGEIGNISRNCYILDLPFFWFITSANALVAWLVFCSTLLLTKATSPLAATFLFVPRSALQLMILSDFKMPVYSWVGVGMCLLASVWFLYVRRVEWGGGGSGGGFAANGTTTGRAAAAAGRRRWRT